MTLHPEQLPRILEAAIMVAGRPLTVADLQKLFEEPNQPNAKEMRAALEILQASYADRGIELRETASGFQFQAKVELSPWLSRLWEERPPKYSRAILETLALIAYRQPITRAEIEEIRGVAVSSHIIKTLQDREWVRVIGYRDTPGKPALYATTKSFLDHLNLKSLDELPPLSDILDVESQAEKLNVQLDLVDPAVVQVAPATEEAEQVTTSDSLSEETSEATTEESSTEEDTETLESSSTEETSSDDLSADISEEEIVFDEEVMLDEEEDEEDEYEQEDTEEALEEETSLHGKDH